MFYFDFHRNFPSKIEEVRPGSLAEDLGLQPGQSVQIVKWGPEPEDKTRNPALPPRVTAVASVDGEYYPFETTDLPQASLPTHPSQIYSSINAFLLCFLLWNLQPVPRRDGIAFCLGMILYAISRFLLEGVRSDEGGQLGTGLSIAQVVGILTILLCSTAIVLISRGKAARAWNWELVK